MDSGDSRLGREWRTRSHRLADCVDTQVVVEGGGRHCAKEIRFELQVLLQGRKVQVQSLLLVLVILTVPRLRMGMQVRPQRIMAVQVPPAQDVTVTIVVVALPGPVGPEA